MFKDFISVPPLAQWPAESKFSKTVSFLTLQVIWGMHLQLVTHCFLTPKPPSSHHRPGVYASGTRCFLTHLQPLPCGIQGAREELYHTHCPYFGTRRFPGWAPELLLAAPHTTSVVPLVPRSLGASEPIPLARSDNQTWLHNSVHLPFAQVQWHPLYPGRQGHPGVPVLREEIVVLSPKDAI